MLPRHSDVQTSKHPDLSPSVRFSPPPLLELEYHLFSSVVSFSISFYDLVASPLYLLLHRVSPSSPFAQTIPKRLCRRLMPMLACAGNNDLPSSLSLPLSISIYSSLSLSLYFRVYLAFWSDPLDSDVYTKTHGWGRERDRDRGRKGGRERRETCRSILCAATTRSHPSPRRAATMNP